MFATPTVRTLTRYNERKTSPNARKVKHDIMFKKNYLFITVCAKKVVNFFEEKSASLRKICVLRATTKKVVNFFASLNLPPPGKKILRAPMTDADGTALKTPPVWLWLHCAETCWVVCCQQEYTTVHTSEINHTSTPSVTRMEYLCD